MMRFIGALLAAMPLVAAAQDASPGPASTPPPPEPAGTSEAPATPDRPIGERFYVGVGLGTAYISDVGGDAGGRAYRIRLGLARSPRLMLGFEGGLSTEGDASLSTLDVGATFFPSERFFYLRGAFGLASLTDGAGSMEQGVNLLVGLGVALGRPRGLTVTVNLESQYHQMGHDSLDRRSGSLCAWLGLDWY